MELRKALRRGTLALPAEVAPRSPSNIDFAGYPHVAEIEKRQEVERAEIITTLEASRGA